MYITRINLKNLDESTKKNLLNTLAFCAHRDPTFKFEIKDNMLIIRSLSHTQAMKRGAYIRAKFPSLYYNVERIEEVKPHE